MANTSSTDENRLGDCEVCGSYPAIYTCPRCEVRTCGIKCVNIHKKELNCDGIRNKTKYIPLSQFTNLDLLSDYRMLEDVNRTVENLKKIKLHRNYNRQLFSLKKALNNRKTNFRFLPEYFSRRKENTTYFDFQNNLIYWRLESIFVQANNFKIIEEQCDETLKLSHIYDNYLNVDKYKSDKIKFYQSVGLNGINLYLKAEKKQGDKYYLLDQNVTLKKCLENKKIIEFPTIYVTFKDYNEQFDVIDSDDEISNDISNPSKFISEIVRAEEKQSLIGNGSLLFGKEYTDAELLTSDEDN